MKDIAGNDVTGFELVQRTTMSMKEIDENNHVISFDHPLVVHGGDRLAVSEEAMIAEVWRPVREADKVVQAN